MKIKATKQKAEEALEKLNRAGSVYFDGTNGSFSVKGVDGRFKYGDEILTIVIDDKPFFVSEEYVESEIREFFNT